MNHIKNLDIDSIPAALKVNLEMDSVHRERLTCVLEQQDQPRGIVDTMTLQAPVFGFPMPALNMIKECIDSGAMKTVISEGNRLPEVAAGMGSAMETLHNSSAIRTIGELVSKTVMSNYQFESPILNAFNGMNNNIVCNLATGLTSLLQSPVLKEIQSISSAIGNWLQEIDFSPLTGILESIKQIGFDHDYKEVNEVFLKAMFDARWFPYAEWMADYNMVSDLLEVLDTSRASKNRIKKIDKLIFSYYTKEEINNLKRGWREMDLPSYITRILVQSIQAYHRREYALTVSALTTLWEGIIQDKVNDKSYRISKRTRENLAKLIEENEFDKIISSFCEEFIFYICKKPEDVKPDVPGRHGIAHCWYEAYPSRKVALNAILFTDFLLKLRPLEK